MPNAASYGGGILMNISQMLRGIVGSAQPVDAKALELKIGQVVKGIVLQLLAEQEAMVNIGGVPIRARLETPLQAGQMTLLQVQPESSTGQVVLKPLGSSNIRLLETSLTDLVKSFGLKDTEANRNLLQQLHAASIPLDTKTIKSFQPLGSMSPPPNVPLDQWTEAAIVAHKKGLPLKTEIVAPLHQTMFGKSLPQSLEQLKGSLQTFVQTSTPQIDNSDTMTLVRKLIETISSLTTGKAPNTTNAANTSDQGGRMMNATAKTAQMELNNRSTLSVSSSTASPTTTPTSSSVSTAHITPTSVQSATTPSPAPAAQASTVLSVPSASATSITTPATTTVTQPPASASPELTQQTTEKQDVIRPATESAALPNKAPANERQLPQRAEPIVAGNDDEPWIKQLLKQLGVDHEHRTANLLSQTSDSPDIEELQFRHESVKGLLLQLASSEQMPSALKEAMQQVTQQITGQQLLLGGERWSPFSLVTLFVPIQHQDGTTTASVHIQSKKKQGGNLDAENCRLLFDLTMSTLGNTLVDVQVVNRVVSLQVHNDFPMIDNLLDSLKPEIEAAMKQIGFQFISMKHMPYPEPTVHRSGEVSSSTDARSSVSTTYHSKPYKGVDFRI